MDPCHAFSTKSDGLLMQLHNEVYISANGQKVTVRALWDTGATMSAISHSVAEDLKLVPIGKQIVATPTGSKEVDTFCVDTMLPNNVNFEGIIVIDSEIGSQTAGGEPIGMLVGMDIIGRGDFAVTNHNGRTIFTYRCPSVGSIDFVNQLVMKNKIGTPHGKGNGKRKAKKR